MLSQAFANYIKQFRKPVDARRHKLLEKMNKNLHYAQIYPINTQKEKLNKMVHDVNERRAKFYNAPELIQFDIRDEIRKKQKDLMEFKTILEKLSSKSSRLFENMRLINTSVSARTMDIESRIQMTEGIFLEALNTLIRDISKSKQNQA